MEEASGSDGLRGRWSWRSYLGQRGRSTTYSTRSSSSGTIISTAYTTSTGSRGSSTSTPFFFDGHDLYPEEKEQQIKSLVQEFFGASSSHANNGNIASRSWKLESWFTELGVGWVFYVHDGASAGMSELRSWTRSLHEIGEAIHLMAFLFPEMSNSNSRTTAPDPFQFAQFIQETMSNMLPFVDAILAPNATEIIIQGDLVINLTALGPYERLNTLLAVHGALSSASAKIQLSFHPEPSPSEEARMIQRDIVSSLSTKEAKLGKAIWSTMQQTRTRALQSVDGDGEGYSSCSQISSDIHKATISVMRYISFLLSHYSSVNATMLEAARLGKYVTQTGDLFPLNSMIVDITSCLEQKLVKVSKSFPDQGLGFLFLLNNTYFIHERLISLFLLNSTKDSSSSSSSSSIRGSSPPNSSSLDSYVTDLFARVDNYMDKYIQVCWAPVLSCLFHHGAPFYLRKRNSSALPKFESEFHNTYTAQKLWKVPDPNLRKTLRAAITEAIVPGYTKYIEAGKNVATPKFTPRDLKEMQQELFEG